MFEYSAESTFAAAAGGRRGTYWKRSPAPKLRRPVMNRMSCARRSWRSSVGSPVTVASAA